MVCESVWIQHLFVKVVDSPRESDKRHETLTSRSRKIIDSSSHGAPLKSVECVCTSLLEVFVHAGYPNSLFVRVTLYTLVSTWGVRVAESVDWGGKKEEGGCQ